MLWGVVGLCGAAPYCPIFLPRRAEPVDVVLLEVSQEQFGVGLNPEVKEK